MTLAARILVARAQATSRKAARKRRAELERELAGYATGSVFSPRSDRFARAMLNGFGCCGR